MKIITYEDIGLGDPDTVRSASVALSDMKDMYDSRKGDWEMVLSFLILSLCRAKKSRIADHFKMLMKNRFNKIEPYYQIPDFALDMHTSQGNLLGRSKGSIQGITHFIKEGEKLENENENVPDVYKEIVQEKWKKKKK